ncbi:MAG: DUF1552 domain-containing protein [Deltaproteobacteria bacterium]|nr:DUF1552 domain-containing protein [Deltaproteobacteria bacterium]
MKSKPIARRTVLRGILAGGGLVAVPLPRLGGMLNNSGTAYAQGGPLPKRFVTWFFGNGIVPPRWIPSSQGTGQQWQLSEHLQEIAAFKPYMSLVTGARALEKEGEGHIIGMAALFTGRRLINRVDPASETLDQMIAKKIGSNTPFRSLELGLSQANPNLKGVEFSRTISHNQINAPNYPIYSASAVFTRLFGKAPGDGSAGQSPAKARSRFRQLTVDLVKGDIERLRKRLGREDLLRLDQHLDGIQQLEKQISPVQGVKSCSAKLDGSFSDFTVAQKSGVPEDVHGAMTTLMTYALACDMTRVISYMWSLPAAHVDYRFLGIEGDIHDKISHLEEGDQPQFTKSVHYTLRQFRTYLEALAATPEAGGSLLDNSVTLLTSELSFGRTHSSEEFPMLLVGKAGGALRGDVHVRLPSTESTARMALTLLRLFDPTVERFGEGKDLAQKPIEGLG